MANRYKQDGSMPRLPHNRHTMPPTEDERADAGPIPDQEDTPYYMMSPLEKQLAREHRRVQSHNTRGGHARRTLATAGQFTTLTTMSQPNISLSSENPPKMAKLRSVGDTALAIWQGKLQYFNVEVKRYRDTHPYYVSRLSDFVLPDTWRIISEDLLDFADQTDGGLPNDEAVEAFLRREGKYANNDDQAGKVLQSDAVGAFKAIKWELRATNIQGYQEYVNKWIELKSTLYDIQMPKQKQLLPIMRAAIKPPELKKRVEDRMWSGLGPHKRPVNKIPQAWRKKARKSTKYM
jgi:hypothetical protein